MMRKMSEVIQKQRKQSLNIQKQSLEGVLIKRCSEICNTYAEVWFPRKDLLLKPGPEPWTRTLKNLINMDSKNFEPWKTWTLENMSDFRELCFRNKDHAQCDLLFKSSQISKLNFSDYRPVPMFTFSRDSLRMRVVLAGRNKTNFLSYSVLYQWWRQRQHTLQV